MKKWISLACVAVMAFAAVGCGEDNKGDETPQDSVKVEGIFEDTTYEKYSGTTYTLNDDGLTLENKVNGGWTMGWSSQSFSFDDISLTFKVDAPTTQNYKHWIGFAFTAEAETWYDQSYAALVFFRPQYDANGNQTGKATFNIVSVLGGFASMEKEETEVKDVPMNLDGTAENTLTMEYSAALSDWVITVNDTPISVKQGDLNSTKNFSLIKNAMTDGKCYLQFASQREKTDGTTRMTLTKVNNRATKLYF